MPVRKEANREDLKANQDIPCADNVALPWFSGDVPRWLKETNNMYSYNLNFLPFMPNLNPQSVYDIFLV